VVARPSVLLVSQPVTEGVAVWVRQLAGAGVGAGLDVTVACPAGGDLSGWVEAAGAGWARVDMARQPGPKDVAAAAAVRRLLPRHDVVHLHSSKAGAVGRVALRTVPRSGRPASAFTPHGWSWLVGGRLAPAYRAAERALAGVADAVVCVSDDELAAGRPVLGRAAARARVIENGVDVERFSPHGPVAGRGDGPLVVCVGRLTRQKGQDLAVDALAALADQRARLRLVGSGPDAAALADRAAALGVAGRVEMIGTVPDPAPHVRAADVVVVPSRWDGLSLALLEAMACGAAIVAARAEGASVLEGAGVLVPTGDSAAVAAAVDRLLADPGERARLGAAARARAVDRFDVRRSLAATVDLWRELAG
jgi:glycosyltransferase involved in cell wall biosynthesis